MSIKLGVPANVVILVVKSYDTEWTTRMMIPYMKGNACIVYTQNGLNKETISSIIGADRTVGWVV